MSVGKIRFRLDARSYFDAYTKEGKNATWMTKIFRSIAYPPNPADKYIGWYPTTQFIGYHDAWTGDNAGNGGAKTEVKLKGDREKYIAQVQIDKGHGYAGTFFDDLNFAGGNRPSGEPAGKEWNEGLAQLLKEIREAWPACVIEANPQYHDIWPLIKKGKTLPLAPGSAAWDPQVEIAVQQVDMFTKEFGIGPTASINTAADYKEVMEYVEWLHSRGVGIQWSGDGAFPKEPILFEYQQATALLVNDGKDTGMITHAHPAGAEPEEWWAGLDMDLGEPLTARERQASAPYKGWWKRRFTHGIVYTCEPGGEENTLTLEAPAKNVAGETVTKITLKPKMGAMLLRPETGLQAAATISATFAAAAVPKASPKARLIAAKSIFTVNARARVKTPEEEEAAEAVNGKATIASTFGVMAQAKVAKRARATIAALFGLEAGSRPVFTAVQERRSIPRGRVDTPVVMWPFRMVNDKIPFVEQDTNDEIAQCVAFVLSTLPGELVTTPGLGLSDGTFKINGVRESDVVQVIKTWEPRALMVFLEDEIRRIAQEMDIGVSG